METNSPAFRFYSQIIVGLLGLALIVAICIGAKVAGEDHRLYNVPISTDFRVDGAGDDLRILSSRNLYSVGKYFVWEIGGVRLAVDGRALAPKVAASGSSRPIWQLEPYDRRQGTRAGRLVERSWSTGRTLYEHLWDDVKFTVTDGVMTLNGRKYDLLEPLA